MSDRTITENIVANGDAHGDDLILDLGGGETIRLVGYLEDHTAKQINDDLVL